MKAYTTLGSPSTLAGGGGCCAKEPAPEEGSRRPSVIQDATRPELVPRYSSASDVAKTPAETPPLPPVEPKSCCSKDVQDPVPVKAKPCAPATLSRSASTSKPHSTSHTPKPILPRPAASISAAGANAVSTIQTKNGAKHQLILPTSSRTIQVEKSLQRRASGRRPTVGGSKSGAITPNAVSALASDGSPHPPIPGEVAPAHLTGDASHAAVARVPTPLSGQVSPHTASANDALPLPPLTGVAGVATPHHQPFNNHAFDPLLLEPLTGYDFTSGQVTPIEGLDGGIWDLIDDGERWILPSAPPPDDLLGEFMLPDGFGLPAQGMTGQGMLPPPNRDQGTSRRPEQR
jgi:hypothetical protein